MAQKDDKLIAINKKLEEELKWYRKKEKFSNETVAKTKEVYDIARHNSEKIILKSIELAYSVLNDINQILDISKENNIEKIKEELKIFQQKHKFILEEDINDDQQFAEEFAEKIALQIVDNYNT